MRDISPPTVSILCGTSICFSVNFIDINKILCVNLSTLVLLVSIYNPIILTRAKKLLVASEGDKSCNMKWQQSFAFINNSRETKGPTTNQQGGVYGCDRNFCDWFFIALKKWEEKRELHIIKNGLEEKKFGLKSKNKFWWVCTSLSGNVIEISNHSWIL